MSCVPVNEAEAAAWYRERVVLDKSHFHFNEIIVDDIGAALPSKPVKNDDDTTVEVSGNDGEDATALSAPGVVEEKWSRVCSCS